MCAVAPASIREFVQPLQRGFVFLRLSGEGDVTADDLAITFNLSKEPDEYLVDTVSTIAAKELEAAGVKLHAGETVKYIITSNKDKVKEWRARPLSLMEQGLEYDVAKYLELLERAAVEVLDGLIPPVERPRPKLLRDSAALDLPLIW